MQACHHAMHLLLLPCISGLKLLLWWNAHREFSLCLVQSEGKMAKANLWDWCPSRNPHVHLLFNKSVAMTTSRELQKAWKLPAWAICFAPWGSTQGIQTLHLAEPQARIKTSPGLSFPNMATLAHGLLWMLQICLWPRFVVPISFCLLFGFWWWLPFSLHILWICTKTLLRMLCPVFLVSAVTLSALDSALSPLAHDCPGFCPHAFHPYLPKSSIHILSLTTSAEIHTTLGMK